MNTTFQLSYPVWELKNTTDYTNDLKILFEADTKIHLMRKARMGKGKRLLKIACGKKPQS